MWQPFPRAKWLFFCPQRVPCFISRDRRLFLLASEPHGSPHPTAASHSSYSTCSADEMGPEIPVQDPMVGRGQQSVESKPQWGRLLSSSVDRVVWTRMASMGGLVSSVEKQKRRVLC
ncbi:hypothetical protein PHYPSEUDO_004477 [Phytophthora pseudosyringae]|uniref:Uncharacterized protein n=1 Tax=Phytophthora pseudosyringae TaxID=221518 RepID=A0A8T1WMM2_9STRA|nr:hypothetical protein PHYPSEUDO_004477 [Phytophthora pseudosyringae]